MSGDAGKWYRSFTVNRDVWTDDIPKDSQNFSPFGVATGLVLGVDEFVVDLHVKDPAYPSRQGEVADDVLIVGKQVVSRAHGAARIISRDAVGDVD